MVQSGFTAPCVAMHDVQLCAHAWECTIYNRRVQLLV